MFQQPPGGAKISSSPENMRRGGGRKTCVEEAAKDRRGYKCTVGARVHFFHWQPGKSDVPGYQNNGKETRGALPSTTENNPRERVQAITFRSGKDLLDPVMHKGSTSKCPIEEENVKVHEEENA
nr:uncharacterized protein LOC109154451 [Ipomoea batatas]